MAIATTTVRRKPRTLFGSRAMDILVAVLVLLLILLALWPRLIVVVRSGQAGVIWRSYAGGTDVNRIYGEGLHLVMPWNEFFVYNVRMQEDAREYEVLSKDGMHLTVRISVRYRPQGEPFPWRQYKPHALAQLHKSVGPNYRDVLIIPNVASAVRRVMGTHEGDYIYRERGNIERQVFAIIRGELSRRYLDIDSVLLERIVFPPGMRAAIEAKLMEEQGAQRYEHILRKERMEAERKRIEAAGIRDFQRTIADGLTDEYLRWKAIDAMVLISRSENSKIVVIGGPTGGVGSGVAGAVPVIVNTGADTIGPRLPNPPAAPLAQQPPATTTAPP